MSKMTLTIKQTEVEIWPHDLQLHETHDPDLLEVRMSLFASVEGAKGLKRIFDNSLPRSADIQDMPPAGSRCSVCGESQYHTPGGLSCPYGHGGADPL